MQLHRLFGFAIHRQACVHAGINTYKKFSISAPFGGFKESGIGREKGRLGILAYMQQKSIYMGLSEQPNPWSD